MLSVAGGRLASFTFSVAVFRQGDLFLYPHYMIMLATDSQIECRSIFSLKAYPDREPKSSSSRKAATALKTQAGHLRLRNQSSAKIAYRSSIFVSALLKRGAAEFVSDTIMLLNKGRNGLFEVDEKFIFAMTNVKNNYKKCAAEMQSSYATMMLRRS